ncbi:MAG: hypothetical protein AB1505_07500 [Candidatus Latescibacterota bacterium]
MSYELRVWERPSPGGPYAIGGDPAEGLPEGDDSVLEVLDCRQGLQVAELQGKLDPFTLGELAWMLGTLYNHALVALESTKDGGANPKLFELGYRRIYYEMADRGKAWDEATARLGLYMNLRSRHRLTAQARKWMAGGSVRPRSVQLLDQCNTFVLRDTKYQAIPGGHDDLVMAWVIAIEMMRVQLLADGVGAQGLAPLVNGQPVEPRGAEDLDVAEQRPRSERLAAHTVAARDRLLPTTTMGNLL